ncbi:UNVERIFIED_CONTAM: hypothetical protein GTU68_054606, partial [Idotea baltica]|nr:hypothetical protein [Idotea baltica]
QLIAQIKRKPGGKDGAEILGVHLEGPFISPSKKGAHPVNYIRELDKGLQTLREVYGEDFSNVAMVTLAPELPGANEVVKHLVQNNVVVSLGHSNGDLLDGEKAVESGATFITHLFNAMLPVHHRGPRPGRVSSQLIPRPVFYGIIADGIHTHPAAVRIAHRTHPKGLVLVTDAMAALGLGDGRHQIGQLEVEMKGRRAYILGTDTLAGSIAPMDECIRRFLASAEVGIVDGVAAASAHPAIALGIAGRKGTLDFGADADLVFLDGERKEEVRVWHTFIAGECVYSAPMAPALVVTPA